MGKGGEHAFTGAADCKPPFHGLRPSPHRLLVSVDVLGLALLLLLRGAAAARAAAALRAAAGAHLAGVLAELAQGFVGTDKQKPPRGQGGPEPRQGGSGHGERSLHGAWASVRAATRARYRARGDEWRHRAAGPGWPAWRALLGLGQQQTRLADLALPSQFAPTAGNDRQAWTARQPPGASFRATTVPLAAGLLALPACRC